MFTVPWIINNMISEQDKSTKLRRPSEVELKVQKSLQQLTVPDWYTNKYRASPKIITDRRPIETRPAPWKDNARNRPSVSNNPQKNATPNTAVVRPVAGNDAVSQSEWEKLNDLTKSLGVKASPQISKTFPKITPSRKIQNINIVFPTSAAAPKTKIRSSELGGEATPKGEATSDKSAISVDSLEESSPQKMSSFKKDTISVRSPQSGYSVNNPTARTLTFNDSPRGKISRSNYQLPDAPLPIITTTTSRGNFNFRDEISAEKAELLTPRKFYNIAKITMDESSRSLGGFSTPGNKIDRDMMSRTIDPSSRTSQNSPNENDSSDSAKEVPRDSMNDKLFSTPRKSTEMENIIKSNQSKRSSGRSFVEEIIEELNAKCSPKVKSTYVSPTSKNFVKQLVRALEKGYAPKNNEPMISGSSYIDNDSKSISNSSSASTSGKDSDSGSDSEPKHSRSFRSSNCSSPFRSFSRALEYRDAVSRESVTPYVDDEDESVYWIPLPICKLPRTSSLKNMMSRLSSPSTNPAQEVSTGSGTGSRNLEAGSGWGETFDKRQPRSRQLFRIDETTVIDSGYSDRSGTNSSSSSVVDESWYEDSEITRTASERSDDSDNCSSHSLQRTSQLRMLRSRQRTSVV